MENLQKKINISLFPPFPPHPSPPILKPTLIFSNFKAEKALTLEQILNFEGSFSGYLLELINNTLLTLSEAILCCNTEG